MRFPVGLPNGRTPLEWALAAAASSFSWPVADNVRSISVLRRLESLPRPGYHDHRGPSWTTAMRVIIMPIPSAFVLDPRSVQGITASDFWAFPTLTWPPRVCQTVGCTPLMSEMMTMMMMLPSIYAGPYAGTDIEGRCNDMCRSTCTPGAGT